MVGELGADMILMNWINENQGVAFIAYEEDETLYIKPTINPTRDQMSWLINGIEVEMEANRSTQKDMDMPVDETELMELKAAYAELETLEKMLKEAK